MFSRRAFTKRLAAIVATVALAPEIAFRVKLNPTPPVPPPEAWKFMECIERIMSWEYEEFRRRLAFGHEIDPEYDAFRLPRLTAVSPE